MWEWPPYIYDIGDKLTTEWPHGAEHGSTTQTCSMVVKRWHNHGPIPKTFETSKSGLRCISWWIISCFLVSNILGSDMRPILQRFKFCIWQTTWATVIFAVHFTVSMLSDAGGIVLHWNRATLNGIENTWNFNLRNVSFRMEEHFFYLFLGSYMNKQQMVFNIQHEPGQIEYDGKRIDKTMNVVKTMP